MTGWKKRSKRIAELEEELHRAQVEYIRLQKTNRELTEEIVRLYGIISAKTGTCRVGPWCDGCVHQGTSSYNRFENETQQPNVVTDESGRLIYCKKYLSEICPEYTLPPHPLLFRMGGLDDK